MLSSDGQDTPTFNGNQPIMVQQENSRQGFSEKNATAVTVLGALQLSTGFFAVVFQAAATGIENTYSNTFKVEFVGCGIWCGIMIMITGLMGIFAGKVKSVNLTVAFLAFSVILSVLVWVFIGFAAAGLIASSSCSTTSYSRDVTTCNGVVGRVWQAMDSLLVILAVYEFALAVTSAAYCCRALSCCCQESARPLFVLQPGISDPFRTYPCGSPMQPTFLQQGPLVQDPVFANPFRGPGQFGYLTELSPGQMYFFPFAQSITPSPAVTGDLDSNDYRAPDTASAPHERQYCALTASEHPQSVDIVGPSVQVPVVANPFRGPEQVGHLTELSPAQIHLPFAETTMPSPAATGTWDANVYCSPGTASAPQERQYCELMASHHSEYVDIVGPGQVGYLTEQSPGQIHLRFAQAAMASHAATGARDSYNYCALDAARASEETQYCAPTPSEHPEYVDIVGPGEVGCLTQLSPGPMHSRSAKATMASDAATGARDSYDYCAPDKARASEKTQYCAPTPSEHPEYVDIVGAWLKINPGPSVQAPVVANQFRGPEQVGHLTELSPAQMHLPFDQTTMPSPAAHGSSDSNVYCTPETASPPQERQYCELTASENPEYVDIVA